MASEVNMFRRIWWWIEDFTAVAIACLILFVGAACRFLREE
jgi:hypothetical protein